MPGRRHQQRGTDYGALGLAIFAGALLGLVIAFPIGGVRVALGSSVATLLLGLAVGWRNSMRASFAILSPVAIELMKSVGLAGRHGGDAGAAGHGTAVRALRAGLNPLLLLGALAGAQTMTAGLAAVQERSESPVAVIGYSSTVAFGHVLISVAGTVLEWMLHGGG